MKTETLAFWQTLFKGGLSNIRGYNLAWGLAIHTRCDDLDLISRSQVCPNHKLKIVFLILVHCSINNARLLHTFALCDWECI